MEKSDPDLFLTIHANAIPDSQWRGAQVFYHKTGDPQSEVLAKSVQNELVKTLANTDREALAIEKIYLLKKAQLPAILVETGFISNEEERALLVDSKYQDKMAAAISEGIEQYFETTLQ